MDNNIRNRATSGDETDSITTACTASPALVKPIDHNNERYPCCVVWTPLPLVTWILPFVGHMGICDTEGVIHDFAGPFYIGQDCMAFGDPVKYWDLSKHVLNKKGTTKTQKQLLQENDDAVGATTDHFRATQNYNFFCNNCHSFCASAMEAFDNSSSWNMVKLAAVLFFCGKYVSVGRFLKAHLPFFIIVGIIVWVSRAA